MNQPLGITELVLRDGHQSLLATRMRIEDMLPIAEKLDKVGYWSTEIWGGATFDSCIRYLGEDPWERLRLLSEAMPNTRSQMLFRGQNILGYRHYADDVVNTFVERAAKNGMDVFRIFDAMNDMRNLDTAVKATLKVGKHAQGTICYTVSPVHTLEMSVDMGKQLEDMGCHSICIKDMSGLLKPYDAEKLVSRLKETLAIPVALHAHATTGMSTAAIVKAVEAGIDMVDTSISSMSHTYGHSATESVVAIMEDEARSTGLDLKLLEEVAADLREIRKKYSKFEGSLKGIDSRILVAQVPGGMLTNLESQLVLQNADDRFDEVLQEIPRVREDLGFIPLVTPTSQIVGTQAVFNVLAGERYRTVTKETLGILKGEYGKTPAPVNSELQMKVLEGGKPITCRPADLIEDEMDRLTLELASIAAEKGFELSNKLVDDVLIYALFPQIGLKYLKNRDNPDAFETAPWIEEEDDIIAPTVSERYNITVNGNDYDVVVSPEGEVTSMHPATGAPAAPVTAAAAPAINIATTSVGAPMAGNIFKVVVTPNQTVNDGDVILIMEAMKMETEVRSSHKGTIVSIEVKEGDAVTVGQPLVTIA
ncbi:oxaloacetate decarboxylase subunit alpha [Mariprofundus sp. EBB-1]|uniref:sodium-extruding oxaloacetate decarboxylase subunit alpha n=1 Tax=Mariprofundus sp. EBB-1 TaxID=2650971 RepID=UPI000EF18FD8|nr:sodium-extruding oxaloacetate decarboxylase subunit alpha [Mariprofundus sp. EBB-1]RLL52273.1 oxaloacetate decarboxylase subunit alpha [Mariprofundus sp. EBB-1]